MNSGKVSQNMKSFDPECSLIKSETNKRHSCIGRDAASLFRVTSQDGRRVTLKVRSTSVRLRVRVYTKPRKSPAATTEGQIGSPEEIDKTTHDQTLTFHEERPETITNTEFKMIDMKLLSPLTSEVSTDIRKILGRPQQIAKVDWTTAYSANTKLFSMNVPYDTVNPSGHFTKTIWSNRLFGYGVMRAKAVMRVQINAQRFQAGRLICTSFPQPEYAPARYSQTNLSLTFATQLARVELDCSVNSTAILEIPYISPRIGYNIVNGSSNAAVFDIKVYSPLIDPAGTGKVGVTIWQHFEDVELFFPVQPQSGRIGRARGGKSVGEVQDAELGQLQHPSISSMLSGVANVAERAQNVPILSSVARPAAWAAALGSKAAAAFGFSNPSASDGANQMVTRASAAAHNVNGLDMSQKLGLLQDNNVQVLPGAFGTDVDEMSLAHIASRSAYYSNFSWNATHTAGTVIVSYPISPLSFAEVSTIGTQATQNPTPLAYLANFFRYFRGTIKLCFKFVKTEFHSGRLLVSYAPSLGFVGTNALDYTFREVIDLREQTEYSVVLPFVSDRQYLDNYGTNYTYDAILGYLAFEVINELVAPPTVGANIQILVEASGHLDNEFACPVPGGTARLPILGQGATTNTSDPNNFPPILPGAIPFTGEYEDATYVVPQVAGNNTCVDEGKIAPIDEIITTFSGMGITPTDIVPAVYCIGEKVTSLRQLLKRACVWRWGPTGSTGAMGVLTDMTNLVAINAGGSPTVLSDVFIDYITAFSSLFMYYRGGIRVRYYGTDNGSSSGLTTAVYLPGKWITDTNNPSSVVSFMPNMVSKAYSSSINDAIEVECPMWARNHMRVVNQWSSIGGNFPTSDVFNQNTLIVRTQDTIPANYFTRAASDDYELGYFLTTMPTVPASVYTGTQNDVFV